MRKRFVGVAALLVLALALAACGGQGGQAPQQQGGAPAAQQPAGEQKPAQEGAQRSGAEVDRSKLSKELNLFIWTEYMPDEVLQEFEKEYGVKVNYDTYSSNEEALAKLQAGGALYDVVVPSDYMVQIMISQGLLEELDKSNIPNLKNAGKEYLDPPYDPGNRYSVPYMWGTVGIVYNKKYVKPEPTSWGDLWKPEYKGRVVLLDDSREVMGMALQLLGYSKNETDRAKLEEAKKKLIELLPNVKAFDSDSPKTLILSEEVWIGQTWNGEAALAMQENPDIGYVLPKEKGGRWQDNLVIPKGAPHKYTAEVFINYLYRPEVAAKIASAFPYGSPNVEAVKLLDAKIRQNAASYPPADKLAQAEWITDVGEATELYDQFFTEVKSSK
ncbi:polyamine ABC transporter substrate-binding protein [Caldinitratiruptor microaerophilus]|uniref:Periplasmic spermidine/putrescine-binding protein n=1 Tax=Caldinitratiruptor microaerophilus TaxID=671077 RepID=A0AA35CPF8_9FIRM|nr:spermidine/putrescine ABC transporter substrate-binding protein [Caldinitratiruptor microaerophilus]BDG62423.1 periplasmic spermidine/putrescine-binding protein [Caldinitratiruptor microaerophilus]